MSALGRREGIKPPAAAFWNQKLVDKKQLVWAKAYALSRVIRHSKCTIPDAAADTDFRSGANHFVGYLGLGTVGLEIHDVAERQDLVGVLKKGAPQPLLRGGHPSGRIHQTMNESTF
jgi:hypothetical protein